MWIVWASWACRRDGMPGGSFGESKGNTLILEPCVILAVSNNGGETSIAAKGRL